MRSATQASGGNTSLRELGAIDMTTPLTEAEIDYARRLAAMDRDGDPEKGVVIGLLLGAACWLVIGLVLYFTCFN